MLVPSEFPEKSAQGAKQGVRSAFISPATEPKGVDTKDDGKPGVSVPAVEPEAAPEVEHILACFSQGLLSSHVLLLQ
jgi:hypothetical protein